MAVSNVQLNELGASTAYARRRDVFDVTCDYVTSKPSSFLKALYVLPGFAKNLNWLPSDHAGLNNFSSAAKFGKLAFAPSSWVDKVQATQVTLSHWLRGDPKTFKLKYGQKEVRQVTAFDVVRDAANCIGPTWDTTEFITSTLVSVSDARLRVFRGVNGAALTFGMGCNLLLNTFTWINDSKYASLKGAEKDKKFTEMTGYLFKMAKEISFIALGVMVVLSAFFHVVFSSMAFAAVSASTVVFDILEYYHENLGTEKNLT
ncbi:MAG: hypothetical protein P0S96_07905 [Simkaniaceae bacterium]|nr:hypothetical protein [Candidatus Sacchlamyda saccharinae]